MAVSKGKIYNIAGYAGSSYYLNRWGSGSVSSHQNVTLYSKTPDLDQQWYMQSVTGGYQILSMLNKAYGLNIYPPQSNNCDLYPVSGNANDATVVLQEVPNKANVYRIKLANYNLYLTAASNSSGANVYWAASNNATSQQWKFTEVTTTTPVEPTNYQWPTISKSISQYFSTGHHGIDILPVKAKTEGDPIYAFASGKVVRRFDWTSGTSGNDSMGNCLFIHHNNPKPSLGGQYLRTLYMHMQPNMLVKTGDYVTKGQVIGYMGNTGYSTGPHLHFGMQANNTDFKVEGGTDRYIDGSWIDPFKYF